MRLLCLLAVLALAAACEGPAGPTGPEGPQGPPGPAGPAGAVNRADATGVFGASGGFTMALPGSAVAGGTVPAIACYQSSDGLTWLVVDHTPDDPFATFCGLTGIPNDPGVTIINGIVGFFYYLIAVW